jgi:endonuclease YncB( thermonuclease family)
VPEVQKQGRECHVRAAADGQNRHAGAILIMPIVNFAHGRRMVKLFSRAGRLALLIALLALPNSPARANDLVGQASIIDGDTIEIHGTRIRLFGIDAPEHDQLCRDEESDPYRCGQKASNALYDFVAKRPVECVEVDRDRYQRIVGVCTDGAIDLADWLVRHGFALDWPLYSKGRYAAAQAEAKRDARGMWKGSYVEPWRFRACRRAGGRPSECSDEGSLH